MSAILPERLCGLVLPIIGRDFDILARRNPHDADGVSDYAGGGGFPAFGSLGHEPIIVQAGEARTHKSSWAMSSRRFTRFQLAPFLAI